MEKPEYARLTVLVDNLSLREDLATDYGLSIYIEVGSGASKWRLLFDVSGSPWALLHNARLLGTPIERVDHIIISHMHRDHYYALRELGEVLKPRIVYLPEPRGVSNRVSEILENVMVERTAYVRGRVTVAPGVEAFGPVGSSGEISLTLNVADYRLLIVACGHAGLRQIFYWSNAKHVDILMGGFHLKNASRDDIEEVAHLALERANLVIGLHCTHWGSGLLGTLLGTRYIDGGVGLTLSLDSRSGLLLYPPLAL
ncbi:beta-lactamase superfamily hydrolase [Pyrolobus fumarii 1A]|uniref:Beta-lactamase superfamily hydrolase n=1 Tax=Pyrolobus fumarii (strain DSM 11204 / 1A) TaxID=694429 RepID=G0ECL9_PYRF1|nr:MBL fold metallo-hydrolase [Pyrolobus fumarii]AEM39589.1 beta-lactamase superfamily hydrolase [Pyrolobus fumarii 1A]